MTYVVSDIHGNYQKFKELLELIRFSEKDVMYVLGDIVDYGDEPIELLCDLSMRYNVLPILGEHDYTAQRLLCELDKIFRVKSGLKGLLVGAVIPEINAVYGNSDRTCAIYDRAKLAVTGSNTLVP